MGLLDGQLFTIPEDPRSYYGPLAQTDNYMEMLKSKLAPQQTAQPQPTPPPMQLGGPPPPQAQGFNVDPQSGLNEQQRLMLGQHFFGNLGATLLAAGQKLTSAQRAQYLSQLGNASYDPYKLTEMQKINQQTIAASRQNAAAVKLKDLFASPDFQKSIGNMNPVQRAAFQGAMEAGDISTLQKIADDWMTTKITPQGDLYNPAQQTLTSGTLGTTIRVGSPQDGGQFGGLTQKTLDEKAANFNPSTYGLPENAEVNPIFHAAPEEKQKQMADFAMGRATTQEYGRNFWAKYKVEQDIKALFPWYKPEEAEAAHSIYKSMNDKKSAGSMFSQSRAINGALEHIVEPNGMLDTAKDLNQGQIQLINKFKNEVNAQTGDPKVDRFLTLLHSLQGEVGKFIVNGKPPVNEMQKLDSQLNTAKSPEQIREVLDGYVFLMKGLGDGVDKTNMRLTGPTYVPDKMSLLDNKDTRELLEKYNKNTWGKPQSNGGGTTTTNVPWTMGW